MQQWCNMWIFSNSALWLTTDFMNLFFWLDLKNSKVIQVSCWSRQNSSIAHLLIFIVSLIYMEDVLIRGVYIKFKSFMADIFPGFLNALASRKYSNNKKVMFFKVGVSSEWYTWQHVSTTILKFYTFEAMKNISTTSQNFTIRTTFWQTWTSFILISAAVSSTITLISIGGGDGNFKET